VIGMADWWAGYLWGLVTWPLAGAVFWAGFWVTILLGTLRRPK
jgi:hypothetical protein